MIHLSTLRAVTPIHILSINIPPGSNALSVTTTPIYSLSMNTPPSASAPSTVTRNASAVKSTIVVNTQDFMPLSTSRKEEGMNMAKGSIMEIDPNLPAYFMKN